MDLSKIPESKRVEVREAFQKDHKLFCSQVLGLDEDHFYPHQERVLDAMWKYTRTAVQSCHDMGKTHIAGTAVLAYMFPHPNTIVVTTAPSHQLLQNQLWAEMRSVYKRSKYKLGGTLLDGKPSLHINDKWFAIGMTPPKSHDPAQSDFQGFHADHIVILFDEATGIPKKIWDMAESMMTSHNVKFWALGNPTDPSSEFANCFKGYQYHKIKITCFDSPNLQTNGLRNINDLRNETEYVKSLPEEEREAHLNSYKVEAPFLLTARFVIGALIKWGFDSPWFQARILGEFPKHALDTLLSPSQIEESFTREIDDSDSYEVIGVDVARFGSDETVITRFKGKIEQPKVVTSKQDLVQTFEMLKNYLLFGDGINVKKVGIDDSGLGGGLTDQIRHDKKLMHRIDLVPLIAAAQANEPEKYLNQRAEMYWLLAQDVKEILRLQKCDESGSQLSSIKYKITPKSQIQIESKDDMKRRGMPSPDKADSLAMANYMRHSSTGVSEFPTDDDNDRGTLAGSLGSRNTEW